MNIALLPLDERPVNMRYPAMIAAIAGAQVTLPPSAVLSAQRRPADHAALAAWLLARAPTLDGLIVSCEMLGYGGLIASRISDEPASAVLARLDVLRTVKRMRPDLPIYGFNVITRVSNGDDAVEEPDEWAQYGTRLYQFSQLLDQQEQGQPVADELAALAATVPATHRERFLARRFRNHIVNLAVMQMLAENVFALLVLSSDDTSPVGLPSREKRILAGWVKLLGLGNRLLMYPGADEVGCVLLARLINERAGLMPTFAISYAPPDAAANIAAYEDSPIGFTVERQIAALGGQRRDDGAIWVGVNAPVARHNEWHSDFAAAERETRFDALQALVNDAATRQARGVPVVIADVAYPNGADPVLIALLQAQVALPSLAAYGAWNTAGNTIGTALAQASATQLIRTDAQREAHEQCTLHRFSEDWAYQHIVRADVRQWLRDTHHVDEPTTALMQATTARIERQLDALIGQLPGFAGRYRIAPGSVRLPWNRTFEVDFDLTAL